MSKTLYRTYRPHAFSDVIGQDHIITTLQNAVRTNRVGHAYLFTGPRGTGKTTIARIFAVAVNTSSRKDQQPLSPDVIERLQNGRSMDIIEIDAASSTSVEGIRTLRETIALTPSEAHFKVYIIDEVHMLSTSAFNALLKTLEEPPAHVIFILATTDVHKVPETILSRCQRFDFARFSVENIIKKLSLIAQKEKIQISDEALEMIAIAADGGMRDAESLLAQVFALEDQKITAKEVSMILGTSTSQEVIAFITALCSHDVITALSTLTAIANSGLNLETFARSTIEKLRMLLYLSLAQSHRSMNIQKVISIPKKEIEVLRTLAQDVHPQKIIMMIEECATANQKIRYSTIQQLPLEIAAIRICENDSGTKIRTSASMPSDSQAPIAESIVKKNDPKKNTVAATHLESTREELDTAWQKCITDIGQEYKTLAQLLSQCSIQMQDDNTIMIAATYAFYKDKLSEHNNRAIIEKNITMHFKKKLKINIITQNSVSQKNENSSELLTYAQQLMGGAITSQ